MRRVSIILLVLLMAALNCVHADDESTEAPSAIAEVMTSHTENGYRIQSFSILSFGEWAVATLINIGRTLFTVICLYDH